MALCVNWHSGQFSDFYTLQCNGGILDAAHASGVASEARRNLAGIDADHGDHGAMRALMEIADEFPAAIGDDEVAS